MHKTEEHIHECGCECHCHDAHEHHDGCGCSHEHTELKPLAVRLILGAALGAVGFFAKDSINVVIFAAAYLILGYDVLLNALRNLFRLKPLDENFLMTIAAVGAFVLGEYAEAVAVMLFYQIGELLTHNAVEKTRSSIAALTDVRPDTARIITAEGIRTVQCREIEIGTTVLVGAGERIPVDGVISNGHAMLDTSSLTGESMPRAAETGDRVLAGMISTDGSLEITAEKEFSDSTLSRILALAEEAQEKKSHTERFITSFAKIYTPLVVLAALLVAFVPPLLSFGSVSGWVYRALSFLVISCPCALVVSVPLTFFAGMGCASKNGVLIKNGLTLETLSKVKTVAFDKTGTLTIGAPELTEIRVNGSKAELLELAAYAECDSTHPIANAIGKAYSREIDRSRISSITEIPARGVEAVIDGMVILVGSEKLMTERGIELFARCDSSCVYVAKEDKCIGYIGFGDRIKPTCAKVVEELTDLGVHTAVLSGDNADTAHKVADEIGIDSVFAELLPHEKAEHIAELGKTGDVLFVGDGINDSPALASAAVGAAMGGVGSDAAVEAADMVIMGDELLRIPGAISLSRSVVTIARQNIVLSVGIKLIVMIICALGIGGMWPAIFADVGVCVITVANALRAYYVKTFAHLNNKADV